MREHYRVLVQFAPLWQMEMYFIGSDRCLFWNWVIRESFFSIPFHSWTPIQPSYWGMENPIKARVWNCGGALGNSWGLGTLANSHCKGQILSNVELLTGAISLEGSFSPKQGQMLPLEAEEKQYSLSLLSPLKEWRAVPVSFPTSLILEQELSLYWGLHLKHDKITVFPQSWGCSKEIILNS